MSPQSWDFTRTSSRTNILSGPRGSSAPPKLRGDVLEDALDHVRVVVNIYDVARGLRALTRNTARPDASIRPGRLIVSVALRTLRSLLIWIRRR